ncbi:U3 small nucleolar ribonucleoprotein complex, subunit Mpp10 [Rhodocollybia butyracea]|uniref:U3 small nucleolar ribonucleoprotein protein MPP10 n=1 Tax=Rhodocollybia butyracea TaxID=206335 RepID=A0A9P5PVZ2_9AGAR|nr:U3 small nucleolar ribonucleoprotein complex, subunit Mpp10 [Rhodocollybia butyracea]
MSTAASVLSSVPPLAELSRTVDENPEALYPGSLDIQNAALQAAKYIFDMSVQSETVSKRHLQTLFSAIKPSEAPQTRSQARKRKRSPTPPAPDITFKQTPIDCLFVDGMDDEQIWSQLDLRANNICEVLDNILEKDLDEDDLEGKESGSDEEEEEDLFLDEQLKEAIRRVKNGEDVDFTELGLDDSLKDLILEGEFDDEDESEEEEEEEPESEESDEEMNEEEEVALHDPSDSEDADDPRSMLDIVASKGKKKSTRMSHSELDDGFFDLNTFNAQTEWTEAKTASSGHLDDEEEDDDQSVDLFAPVDLEEFDEEDADNAGSARNFIVLYYNDFFKPPRQAKKPSKAITVRFRDEVRVRPIKAKGKNLPVKSMYANLDDEDESEDDEEVGEDAWNGIEGGEGLAPDDSEDDDIDIDNEDDDGSEDFLDSQRDAISRVKDDLFADDDEEEQKGMFSPYLSTHERRIAALKEQISEFEAENVGPKDWVLMGEADSRSRPQNSLLEEDLEFDRVMKAVPVITEEVVQGLEERIKARILENRFDDVVRIRPLEDKPFLPSRFFELKDTKSTQSLAQIYEDEFVAAQTNGIAGEDRDGKLKKEHEEVEQLWESICYKLDALCNTHFTPKQPKATISTISNVSTATLESALPTANSVNTLLAPEEVFAPSSSGLRARSEMTPAEKQSLRRKERKTKRKMRDVLNKSTDKYARVQKGGSLKKQKEEALKSVVKAGKGVTVVGKTKKDILGKGKKSNTS